MKKTVWAVISGVFLVASSSVQAADMPVMPVKGAPYLPAPAYYNWTGFYGGIVGGYGFGQSRWTNTATGVTTGDFNIDGFIVGGTLGYNQQIGRLVWGIEGDISYSDIKGSTATNCGTTCTTRNSWLATVRGRLGWAFDRWMPFITAGGAAGDIKATSFLGSSTSTEFGWTVGGGIEAALWDNWTWKAEYLYVDLADGTCSGACTGGAPINVQFHANLVRVGLNYRF